MDCFSNDHSNRRMLSAVSPLVKWVADDYGQNQGNKCKRTAEYDPQKQSKCIVAIWLRIRLEMIKERYMDYVIIVMYSALS